jgi:hypothetical protein
VATKTDLCNMAILSLRGGAISNIDQDSTTEALACKVYYDQVLQSLFEDFEWPFATTEAVLGKVSDNPTDEWEYAYAYPVDAARLIKIASKSDEVVLYSVNYSKQGRLIYTNEEDAKIVYVKKVEDTGQYPALFQAAFSAKLASAIAVAVCDGDLYSKLGDLAEQRYTMYIAKAKAFSQNEMKAKKNIDSEMVTSRQ